MAVRKKSRSARDKSEPLLSPETIEAIQEDVRDLYIQHEKDIEAAVEDSEDKKITLGFQVVIDKAESAPQVKTRLRYSQSVTDERIRTLSDPKQPTLLSKEDLAATRKPPGRPKKSDAPEPESDGDKESGSAGE